LCMLGLLTAVLCAVFNNNNSEFLFITVATIYRESKVKRN